MSIKEMSRVWSDSPERGNDLLLLLALADNASDSGYCYPGIDYLAKKTRMSRSAVLRRLKHLEDKREIAIIHRRNKGNRYMILSGCTPDECLNRIERLSVTMAHSKSQIDTN